MTQEDSGSFESCEFVVGSSGSMLNPPNTHIWFFRVTMACSERALGQGPSVLANVFHCLSFQVQIQISSKRHSSDKKISQTGFENRISRYRRLTQNLEPCQVCKELSIWRPASEYVHRIAHHGRSMTFSRYRYGTCAIEFLPSAGRRREYPGIVVTVLAIGPAEPKTVVSPSITHSVSFQSRKHSQYQFPVIVLDPTRIHQRWRTLWYRFNLIPSDCIIYITFKAPTNHFVKPTDHPASDHPHFVLQTYTSSYPPLLRHDPTSLQAPPLPPQ